MNGERLRFWDTLPSTNAALKAAVLAGENIPDGTAWATTRQTAGRGRLGRTWETPDGQALALSIFLAGTPHPAVSALAGIAVTRALRKLTGAPFALKWPNDSICGERKVGGLLCEGVWSDAVTGTVVGIGLNLLSDAEFFKSAGLPYGGSVRMMTGHDVSPREAARAVLTEWDDCVHVFREKGFAAFRAEYEELCATLGKEVRVLHADGTPLFGGTAIGVDDEGALLVRSADGEIKTCRAGEVSVRGLYGYV